MKKADVIQRIPALVIAEDEQERESIRFNLYLDGFEAAAAFRQSLGSGYRR